MESRERRLYLQLALARTDVANIQLPFTDASAERKKKKKASTHRKYLDREYLYVLFLISFLAVARSCHFCLPASLRSLL